MENQGTPKSLKEAIHNGCSAAKSLHGITQAGLELVIYNHVKDYLAQHFQKAMFEHIACEQVLRGLFEEITALSFKRSPMTIEEWKRK